MGAGGATDGVADGVADDDAALVTDAGGAVAAVWTAVWTAAGAGVGAETDCGCFFLGVELTDVGLTEEVGRPGVLLLRAITLTSMTKVGPFHTCAKAQVRHLQAKVLSSCLPSPPLPPPPPVSHHSPFGFISTGRKSFRSIGRTG